MQVRAHKHPSHLPPDFDPAFRDRLADLFTWRRDVRRFRPDPLPESMLARLLDLACLAPSVGLSQPWRFILVNSSTRRQAIRANFEQCNADAPRGTASVYGLPCACAPRQLRSLPGCANG